MSDGTHNKVMGWQVVKHNEGYSLTMGTYHAHVWRPTEQLWMASVGLQRQVIACDVFATREEAQAWCLTQVAELRAREADDVRHLPRAMVHTTSKGLHTPPQPAPSLPATAWRAGSWAM